MNQHLRQSSSHRYTRKRNSFDAIKTSFSLKNAKKSLPEVCIDLNQHHKKHKLALHPKPVKGNDSRIEISHFDDKKKVKAVKKKDQLTLKNMYNTSLVRHQDENRNALNEYRDEIQLLRIQNEQLKLQNQRLLRSQDVLGRKLYELKQEKHAHKDELRQYIEILETKVDKYSAKIKILYQELIQQKQKQNMHKVEGFENGFIEVNSRIRRKDQLHSHRIQQNKVHQRFKRLTSPSSHQNDRFQWAQELDHMLLYENKGQQAFYKLSKGHYGQLKSQYE